MTTNPAGLVPEFTVGDRLRKAREVAGIEQKPFADLLGVSRGTISNYERGLTERYKPIVLRAWAMATGVSLERLESGVETTQPPPEPPSGRKGDALEQLTREKRRRVRPLHRPKRLVTGIHSRHDGSTPE